MKSIINKIVETISSKNKLENIVKYCNTLELITAMDGLYWGGIVLDVIIGTSDDTHKYCTSPREVYNKSISLNNDFPAIGIVTKMKDVVREHCTWELRGVVEDALDEDQVLMGALISTEKYCYGKEYRR